MATLNRSRFVSCFVLLSIALWSCGGSEPTKQEKVTKLLIQKGGTWKPSAASNAITLDGANDVKDELFPGMEMQFSKGVITTSGDHPYWDQITGDNPIWPASDTWTFKDKKADVLIRGSDGREITIVSVSSKELVIEIEWSETTYGGRTVSLPGLYQFTLTK